MKEASQTNHKVGQDQKQDQGASSKPKYWFQLSLTETKPYNREAESIILT